MENVQCFIDCIINANLVIPVIFLLLLVGILLFLFILNKRYELLLGAQFVTSVIIGINLLFMNCYMHFWVWIYLGVILTGSIIIVLVKYLIDAYINNKTVGPTAYLSDIEEEFDVQINVIDSPLVRAFVFLKNIYISIGLLERLEKDEIRAVIAHEVYHLKYSPNKITSSLLAIASLSFYRYSDEYSADRYAVKMTSKESLINALKKLDIKDAEKRIRLISQ
jgi:heat shock protein HtpX